ncbi:hypothetical protein J437_LFUL002741 [Ladona fulva]|uniref:Uncharacterized protein n=1 Tax=Ladona fulva TaxID=123851 RepID=A0A8K0K289_LADFU|nr:hypothetical protein J437_LFUL002741 [Ladona fulva]
MPRPAAVADSGRGRIGCHVLLTRADTGRGMRGAVGDVWTATMRVSVLDVSHQTLPDPSAYGTLGDGSRGGNVNNWLSLSYERENSKETVFWAPAEECPKMESDMDAHIKQRCMIEFLTVYGDNTIDVRQWVWHFKGGEKSVHGKPRSGRPCTAVIPQNEERLDQQSTTVLIGG